MKIKLAEIVSKEIMSGYHGKLIQTQNLSLAFGEVEAGAKVPELAHMNEQVMLILEKNLNSPLAVLAKPMNRGIWQ